MAVTEKYNLTLPGGSDFVDVEVINDNMRKVDAALAGKQDGALLTHTKSGTVHALNGLKGRNGILSAAFRASAAFTAGDTVKVDGEDYTALMQDGSAPETGLFPAGGTVGCIIDTEAKTVNFKGGGGVRLPALTKPAGAAQITKGYQAINAQGEIVTGTAEKYTVTTGTVSISSMSAATVSYSGSLVSALVWVDFVNRDDESESLSAGITAVGQSRESTSKGFEYDSIEVSVATAGKIRIYSDLENKETFSYQIITK